MNTSVLRGLLLAALIVLPFSSVYAQTSVSEISKYQEPVTTNVPTLQSTSTDILLLSQKVDLLEAVNNKTLNTVYWTLGVLATIFLAIVGLNVFFNTSAFRRDLENIKDQTQKEAEAQISIAESRTSSKLETEISSQIKKLNKDIKSTTSAQITAAREQLKVEVLLVSQKEIETQMAKTSAELQNEVLVAKADLLKQVSMVSSENAELKSTVKSLKDRADEMKIEIIELQAFKYQKQEKMGGILSLFEVIEYDINKRPWRLKYTLADVHRVLEEYVDSLNDEQATTLSKILAKITEEEHADIIGKINTLLASREINKTAG